MTEEDFLARWSRRKREVAKADAEPAAKPATDTGAFWSSCEPSWDTPIFSAHYNGIAPNTLTIGTPAATKSRLERRVTGSDMADLKGASNRSVATLYAMHHGLV